MTTKYFPNYQTDEGIAGDERIRAALLHDPSPPRVNGWTLEEVSSFCKRNRFDALLYTEVHGRSACVGVVNKYGDSAFTLVPPRKTPFPA